MLVISRRIGESFVIGENLVATVVDITGDKVVLGVEAPKDVPVERLAAQAGPNRRRSRNRDGEEKEP